MANTKRRVTTSEALGSRIAMIRSQWGFTQDDVARAADALGFRWTRSTVAEIELGQRGLTAEELLALPYVFDGAMRERMHTGLVVTLAELVMPGPTQRLVVGAGIELDQNQVKSWLDAEAPAIEVKAKRSTRPGEAEHKAARALGVPVEQVMDASKALWRRSLTAERDRRLGDVDDDASRQAKRGHVTRELYRELRTELGVD